MYLPKSQYKFTKQNDLPGPVVALVDKLGNEVEEFKEIVLTATGDKDILI